MEIYLYQMAFVWRWLTLISLSLSLNYLFGPILDFSIHRLLVRNRTYRGHSVTLFDSKLNKIISLILILATTSVKSLSFFCFLLQFCNFFPFSWASFLAGGFSFGLFNAQFDSMRLLCFNSNGFCSFHVWYVFLILYCCENAG